MKDRIQSESAIQRQAIHLPSRQLDQLFHEIDLKLSKKEKTQLSVLISDKCIAPSDTPVYTGLRQLYSETKITETNINYLKRWLRLIDRADLLSKFVKNRPNLSASFKSSRTSLHSSSSGLPYPVEIWNYNSTHPDGENSDKVSQYQHVFLNDAYVEPLQPQTNIESSLGFDTARYKELSVSAVELRRCDRQDLEFRSLSAGIVEHLSGQTLSQEQLIRIQIWLREFPLLTQSPVPFIATTIRSVREEFVRIMRKIQRCAIEIKNRVVNWLRRFARFVGTR